MRSGLLRDGVISEQTYEELITEDDALDQPLGVVHLVHRLTLDGFAAHRRRTRAPFANGVNIASTPQTGRA